MTAVTVDNISLDLPILGAKARSLRTMLVDLALGGRLLKDSRNGVHVRALKNVSFSVNEGDRLGIVGHNGSGKTSLLRCLAGIYEAQHGTIAVQGKISSMLDLGVGLDVDSTGRENIYFLATYRGVSKEEVRAALPDIEDLSGLGTYLDLPVRTYSSGMLSRLMFSAAVSFQPDILIMDEWLGAGDAQFVGKAEERVSDFVGQARVVIVATHSFGLVRKACNKCLVLEKGEVVDFGPALEVIDRYEGRLNN